MAHKTLIGGTAYEIGGGKTLINGTAYEIGKGKTLVGGTAYEVSFGPETVTITLTFTVYGDFSYTEVWHNGVRYYYATGNSTTTFNANVGDIIEVQSHGAEDAKIYLNGKLVADKPEDAEYYYTVVSDAVFEMKSWGENWDSSSAIYITDENA